VCLTRALRRYRDSAPRIPTARLALARPRRAAPTASLAPPVSRPRRAAAIPTTAVRAASLGPQPAAPLPPSRRARRRRAAVARRRLRAGEPPPPRHSVRRRRAVARRRPAMPRLACATRRPAEAELGQRRARGPRALRPVEAVGRVAVGRASAVHAGRAPHGHGPRPALCVWAER
jgi:hypothetical protein